MRLLGTCIFSSFPELENGTIYYLWYLLFMVLFCIKWRITLNEIFHNKQTYTHSFKINFQVS
jgi:hypothetical protein